MSVDPAGLAHIFLYSFTALFVVVVNPAIGPMAFHGITEGMDGRARRQLALRVALYFLALMLGAVLVGRFLLQLFGIAVGTVHIAAGLLVFRSAWRTLEGGEDYRHKYAEFRSRPRRAAFSPLTVPVTAGPARIGIATAIGVSIFKHWHYSFATEVAGAVGAVVLVGVLVYFLYGYGTTLIERMEDSGISTLAKLSAFVVLAVAVELMLTGVGDLVDTMRATG